MVQNDKIADFQKWLGRLVEENTSTSEDDQRMQNILRLLGFTEAVCACGIVYPMGKGVPIDIHSMAKKLQEALTSGKQ
jgi:hypothetical protein